MAAEDEAQAQSGSAGSGAERGAQELVETADSAQLGTIVVTAQRRTEDLQRTPVSITAIGSDELASRGISDLANVQGLVPAVEFQPIFNLLVYIRGVGNYDLQPGVDPSITYNVDGNYVAHQYGLTPILFDLQRVEVLRGPQGTLYGRNAAGGAVNLITNRPVFDNEGSVSLEAGNYDLRGGEAMLNVALSPQVALRGSFAFSQHDGYLDSGFNDANNWGGRLRLLAEPTSNLSILVTAEYSEKDEMGGGVSFCPPGTDITIYPACAGVEWDPFLGNVGQGELDIARENYWEAENFAIYAEVNLEFDWGTITWQPAYRYVDYRNLQTYSPFFGYAPSARNKLHSQELRVSSPSGSSIQWVAGLYYARERSRDHTEVLSAFALGPDFIANSYDLFPYITESRSAFGQITVPITNDIRLTGGLRYTDDQKRTTGQAVGYCQNATPGADPTCPSDFPAPPATVVVPTGSTQNYETVTWRAGFEADVGPESMLYGSVSTGFKAGGINQIPAGFTAPATYGPEEITAYALGIKNRFLDNRLQLNAEAFYYDYRGYQTLGITILPGGILGFVTLNSQTAEFYGGEIESRFLITPDDRLDINISLLHAEFTEFNVPFAGQNFTGFRVPNAPGVTVSAGYQHEFDLGHGSLTARIDGKYTSSQWVDVGHNSGSRQGGYTRTDLTLTYRDDDDRFSISAWLRNLENNAAIASYNNAVGLQPYGSPLPPRTFGVRGTVNF
ncbi:TonB-dependent receptor [Parasphingopyxis marina]|uniref:TonB-dependent receptor n=1 Tax=Parasphingopyxis marina TaxID=2761622 RepID=A0A842HTG3_9SPHN|nr:TonB-dependent receptor [Parasphingopyxis marina]MBC2777198.1 TonB-dependent receptor [Parasphingopyxis marina]